jgi:hypothetical protein
MTAARVESTSVVQALLDATPMPPDDLDVDALLATFTAVHAARQTIMETVSPPLFVADADQPILEILRHRQRAWLAALDAAMKRVCDQRIGSTKLKGYAASVG